MVRVMSVCVSGEVCGVRGRVVVRKSGVRSGIVSHSSLSSPLSLGWNFFVLFFIIFVVENVGENLL